MKDLADNESADFRDAMVSFEMISNDKFLKYYFRLLLAHSSLNSWAIAKSEARDGQFELPNLVTKSKETEQHKLFNFF